MSEAVKLDTDKVRMDLLSEVAIEGLSRVLTFGAKKYAADNWRKGMAWRRCIAAALRHLFAFSRGEDFDFCESHGPDRPPDCEMCSGLSHLDHAMCCLMFLSEFQKRGIGTDDRWTWKEVP